MARLTTTLSILIAVCALALGQSPAPTEAPRPIVRVGVLIDGPWSALRGLEDQVRLELAELTRSEFDVRFPDALRRSCDWSTECVRNESEALLADPAVDVVIGYGLVSAQVLGTRESLPKPVIAPFVVDERVQGIPREGAASGRQNLNYLSLRSNASRELYEFQQAVGSEHLAVFVSDPIWSHFEGVRQRVLEQLGYLPAGSSVVVVGDDPDAAFAKIDADVDAVALFPLPQLDDKGLARLVELLIERRLPSYSTSGEDEVAAGILMSYAPADDMPRLARRLALNLQAVILGEDAGTLSVDFRFNERLSINIETAERIGFHPTFDMLSEAVLLGKSSAVAETLALSTALRESLAANLDLRAVDRALAASAENVAAARAAWRPSFSVSATEVQIDEDSASASFGSQAERTLSLGASLSQTLWSDAAAARVTIERESYESRRQDRERQRQDLIQSTVSAYLDVLRARTIERLRRENAELTRTNLRLAELRQRVGYSGPADVYRWQSELANAKAETIAANAQRNAAEIALARLLHRPLEDEFTLVDLALEGSGLVPEPARLARYIRDPFSFRIFREFMVQWGIAHTPEIQAIEASLRAQERALLSTRRALYLPSVGLEGSWTHKASKSGAGSSGGAPLPFSLPTADDTSWNIAIAASLPLTTGGRRRAELRQARETLDQLQIEREALVERVAARVRVAVHLAGASYAKIRLSRESAEAARKNLDLVRNSYSEGAVSVLSLLDAQNAALSSEISAANASYDFLTDLTEVHRAVGRLDALTEPARTSQWFEQLERFYEERSQR